MTQDVWLKAHPYLEPIGRFRAEVDAAAAAVEPSAPPIPRWDDYEADFLSGVPLLRSSDAAIDLEPAGNMIRDLVVRLASNALDGTLSEEMRVLSGELQADPDASRHVVDWLLASDSGTPSHPGLLRCLGWIAITRYIGPLVDAYASWRDEDRWLRRYCPTCGALPAMAQLVGADPGRRRFLYCGCCGTRWRYARTRCPFCEVQSHRLAVVGVDGEGGLRIDYCESCRAYLKTYDGQGSESVMLSDWTSLHLDVVAQDRGLTRQAVSLYELESARHQ